MYSASIITPLLWVVVVLQSLASPVSKVTHSILDLEPRSGASARSRYDPNVNIDGHLWTLQVTPGNSVPRDTLQRFLTKAITDERSMQLSDETFKVDEPGPVFYSNYEDPQTSLDYLLMAYTMFPAKSVTRRELDTILRTMQRLVPHNIGLFTVHAYDRGQHKLMVTTVLGGGYPPGSSGKGFPGGWDADISSGEDSSPGEKP